MGAGIGMLAGRADSRKTPQSRALTASTIRGPKEEEEF
jgi:hypothetical protein